MHHCPRCETKARVIEVRHLSDGGRRRRLACQSVSCGYRWTIRQEPKDPLPPGFSKPRRKGTTAHYDRPLNDDELLLILERQDLSNVQLGKILGRSRELIRQVRSGKVYADRLVHIPRWSRTSLVEQRSCEQCAQWLGYCSLGHPDPEEEGLRFATDCLDFLKRASAGPSPAAAAD
jgi:transcriptional regulator NrdR family protein